MTYKWVNPYTGQPDYFEAATAESDPVFGAWLAGSPLSGFVPYSGASGDVDLGAHNLDVTDIYGNAAVGTGLSFYVPDNSSPTQTFQIRTDDGGGSVLSSHLGTNVDNTHDIGANGTAWRYGYFGSGVYVSGDGGGYSSLMQVNDGSVTRLGQDFGGGVKYTFAFYSDLFNPAQSFAPYYVPYSDHPTNSAIDLSGTGEFGSTFIARLGDDSNSYAAQFTVNGADGVISVDYDGSQPRIRSSGTYNPGLVLEASNGSGSVYLNATYLDLSSASLYDGDLNYINFASQELCFNGYEVLSNTYGDGKLHVNDPNSTAIVMNHDLILAGSNTNASRYLYFEHTGWGTSSSIYSENGELKFYAAGNDGFLFSGGDLLLDSGVELKLGGNNISGAAQITSNTDSNTGLDFTANQYYVSLLSTGYGLHLNGTDLVCPQYSEITDGSYTTIDPYNRTLNDSSSNTAFTFSSYTAVKFNGYTTDGWLKTSNTDGTIVTHSPSTGWSGSNHSTDTALDASSYTIGEVVDVLCTLIEQLKSDGILSS